jgi:polysaccharide export outer membrane protein
MSGTSRVFAWSLLLAASTAAAAASQDSLLLRPGDALRIAIETEPSWSGDFPIAEDGTVLLPGLGIVPVAARPFPTVREDLLIRYHAQLVDPAIRITPLVRVAVLGEVMRPGLQPVDPTESLADVLAAAGSLTPLGDRNKIRLVRDGRVIAARLDPGSQTTGLHFRSGDRIFVGRRSWLAQNTPVLLGALGSVTAAVIASILVR